MSGLKKIRPAASLYWKRGAALAKLSISRYAGEPRTPDAVRAQLLADKPIPMAEFRRAYLRASCTFTEPADCQPLSTAKDFIRERS